MRSPCPQHPTIAKPTSPADGFTNFPCGLNLGKHQLNLDGSDRSDRSSGLFKAAGTLLGASWYTQLNQADWHNVPNLSLNDAQIVKYTDYSDYLVGGQSAFWNRQDSGNYWGITGVWRQGFTPSSSLSGNVWALSIVV